MTLRWEKARLPELAFIAQEILKTFSTHRIFAFSGALGSGKTTLIQALCNELQVKDRVLSPTFSLVNEYSGSLRVYHLDLYRLKSVEEVLDIGLEDYLTLQAYCFIEWPGLIVDLLPVATVWVEIEAATGLERRITVTAN